MYAREDLNMRMHMEAHACLSLRASNAFVYTL